MDYLRRIIPINVLMYSSIKLVCISITRIAKIAITLAVLAVASGAVGATTAMLNAATPAKADSCKDQFKRPCHGCALGSQGFVSSDKKCFHPE